MKEIRSDEARRTFRELLNDVEHDGEHVTILRYNTPAAVIVPVQWYEQALAMTRETSVTTYTAAIDTENNELCDVSVVEDDISGYDIDDDGNVIPRTTLSDRYALRPVPTAIRRDHEDVLGVVEADAERVLAENGWRVTGPWEVTDNALYAPAERVAEAAPGPLRFEYETVSKGAVPAGLRWVTDSRETTAFTEVAYAGTVSGGEGSPWRRIASNATRRVEYARLVN